MEKMDKVYDVMFQENGRYLRIYSDLNLSKKHAGVHGKEEQQKPSSSPRPQKVCK